MNKSYTRNYLQIYFWQGLAIILNLVSMFIVTPLLSNNPAVYGIYSLCISLTIFLSYADLGFLGAGFKYASESLARNDRTEEIRITGFVGFILLIFLVPYMIAALIFAYQPQWLLKGLSDPDNIRIARNLLLILAVSAPISIFQRIVQITYNVRVEDFILQRIYIIVNLLKILSVAYFFRAGHYDIVGYFAFFQAMNLAALIASLWIAKKRYQYDIGFLVRSFRFDRQIFRMTKNLAFAALYSTVAWILYYELDSIVIARLLGSQFVAYYAIGWTILSFFRSIFGTIYTPFNARFNHFTGQKDYEGLKKLFLQIVILTMPLILFPVVSLAVLMKPFVYSWVGGAYAPSVPVGTWLILVYVLGFIHYPGGILMVALEKVKEISVVSTINVVLFWAGVALTFPFFGLTSFALFKFAAFIVVGIFYLVYSLRFINYSLWGFFKKAVVPLIVPLAVLVLLLFISLRWMPMEKSKWNLVLVILDGGVCSFIALCLYFVFAADFRNYALKLLKGFRNRFLPNKPAKGGIPK